MSAPAQIMPKSSTIILAISLRVRSRGGASCLPHLHDRNAPSPADLRRGWIAYPEYWAA